MGEGSERAVDRRAVTFKDLLPEKQREVQRILDGAARRILDERLARERQEREGSEPVA